MSAKDLINDINQSANLFQRVKHPQEAALDSRFLLISAETAAAKARTMRIDKNAFDIDDFVSRLRKHVGPGAYLKGGVDSDDEAEVEEDEDEEEENLSEKEKERRRGDVWFNMGRLASQFALRVPTIDFM